MKRFLRIVSRSTAFALALILLYGLLLAFPEPLFAHRLEEGAFVVYSRDAIAKELVSPRIREAERRLARSEIRQSGARHRVFVTGSKTLHRLLNGPYYDAIGRNVEIGNAILLPALDREAARVVHFDGRSASLDEILAHEATHTFVQRRLGVARTMRLPFWKKEGYAQYVALDFFSPEIGAEALASPERDPRLPGGDPVPRHYLEAAVVWAHLMKIEGKSFDEVIAEVEPFSRLLGEALTGSRGGP